jgi:membrane protease YdiL (CAAX protease family)
MKNNERIAYGLIITAVIFGISTYIGKISNFDIKFIPNSFLTHSFMLLLSVMMIFIFKKYVDYKFSLPSFKKIIKPIIFGFFVAIITNISISIAIKTLGGKIEALPLLMKMNPLQIFIFVFIYASIAEELLFRGFLLNILKPLKTQGKNIFKRRISISVIISAIAFGLGHLILITTGVDGPFLIRIVIVATMLGVISGYYQEKYDNNAFAIIVHMAGNLMGVIGALLMNLNA